jgi:hypothetical protein
MTVRQKIEDLNTNPRIKNDTKYISIFDIRTEYSPINCGFFLEDTRRGRAKMEEFVTEQVLNLYVKSYRNNANGIYIGVDLSE